MEDLWTVCAIVFFIWLLYHGYHYIKDSSDKDNDSYSTGITNMIGVSVSTTDIFGPHSSRTGTFNTVVAR